MIFKFSRSTLEEKISFRECTFFKLLGKCWEKLHFLKPNQLNTKYLKSKLVLGAGLEPAQALLPTGF